MEWSGVAVCARRGGGERENTQRQRGKASPAVDAPHGSTRRTRRLCGTAGFRVAGSAFPDRTSERGPPQARRERRTLGGGARAAGCTRSAGKWASSAERRAPSVEMPVQGTMGWKGHLVRYWSCRSRLQKKSGQGNGAGSRRLKSIAGRAVRIGRCARRPRGRCRLCARNHHRQQEQREGERSSRRGEARPRARVTHRDAAETPASAAA